MALIRKAKMAGDDLAGVTLANGTALVAEAGIFTVPVKYVAELEGMGLKVAEYVEVEGEPEAEPEAPTGPVAIGILDAAKLNALADLVAHEPDAQGVIAVADLVKLHQSLNDTRAALGKAQDELAALKTATVTHVSVQDNADVPGVTEMQATQADALKAE